MNITLEVFLSVAILLTACNPLQGGESSVVERGEKIDYRICAQDFEWTRPSETEQRAIWESARYAGMQEEALQYPWRHDLLISYGSASTDYDLRNLSGLWTFPDKALENCFQDRETVLEFQEAEIWVLNYKVEEVRKEGTTYIIIAEPLGHGVELIRVPRPAQKEPLTYILATPTGDIVERVVESEYLYWPSP